MLLQSRSLWGGCSWETALEVPRARHMFFVRVNSKRRKDENITPAGDHRPHWSVSLLSRDCRSLVWVRPSINWTWKRYMVASRKRNETLQRTDLCVIRKNKEKIVPMHDLYLPCNDFGNIVALLLSEYIYADLLHGIKLFLYVPHRRII